MIIYHPAYDIYHTSLRILRIIGISKTDCIELERIRIIDFITLFPHEMQRIRMPMDFASLKRKHKETSYNRIGNKIKVYRQMQDYFQLAMQCLISYGAIDLEKYKDGLVCKTAKVDDVLKRVMEVSPFPDIEIKLFIENSFLTIPLDELKQRTNLF